MLWAPVESLSPEGSAQVRKFLGELVEGAPRGVFDPLLRELPAFGLSYGRGEPERFAAGVIEYLTGYLAGRTEGSP